MHFYTYFRFALIFSSICLKCFWKTSTKHRNFFNFQQNGAEQCECTFQWVPSAQTVVVECHSVQFPPHFASQLNILIERTIFGGDCKHLFFEGRDFCLKLRSRSDANFFRFLFFVAWFSDIKIHFGQVRTGLDQYHTYIKYVSIYYIDEPESWTKIELLFLSRRTEQYTSLDSKHRKIVKKCFENLTFGFICENLTIWRAECYYITTFGI